MRNYGLCVLVPLVVSAPALAAETVVNSDRFAAPNGQLGAGLTFAPEQQWRAYAELAFTRAARSDSEGGAEVEAHNNALNLIVGGAYRLRPDIELEAMLPVGWGEFGGSASLNGQEIYSESRAGFAFGNLHLGASYLRAEQPWRLKVGGALEYGPWTHHYDRGRYAMAGGLPAYGGENLGLWVPDAFSIVTPTRFEYGTQLVGSVDAQLGLHFSTDGGNADFSIQLSPGIGYYVKSDVLIGLRLPFTWIPTESGSTSTFFAAQPYGRFDFGDAFLDASLLLNIDEPFGFAFDSGKWWALHFGGGARF